MNVVTKLPCKAKKVHHGPAAKSRLMVLQEEWEALLARDRDIQQRREPLEDRLFDLRTPRLSDPDWLYRASDAALRLTCGVPREREIGDDPAWYHGGYADDLRCTPQITPAAQKRAFEIIGAWERYRGEELGIKRAIGLDLLDAEDARLGQEMVAKRREIMAEKAATVDEVLFKARVTLYSSGEETPDGLCTDIPENVSDVDLALSIVRDLLLMEGGQ
ncbi:hypothetical protein [Xanthobacter aminoxidans]|uniref:Uncharacterized protein n=1 Tax=Xanthobacter aminoxidans TaxID=186280 RepID=A0ABW6Z9W0_9HYPH